MSREYPCIHFGQDGICRKFSDDTAMSYCVMGPCAEQTRSNADRIRAMSDKELAVFLEHTMYDSGEPDWMAVLAWLQKPAGEAPHE